MLWEQSVTYVTMVLNDNRGDRPRPSGGRELLADGGEAEDADADESSESADDADEAENDGANDENGASQSDEESTDEESTSEDETEAKEAPEEEDETNVLYVTIPDGLFLDLLGLEVDLQEVDLQVSAVSGDGNLLGNLLGTVAGLLDAANLGQKLKSALKGLLPFGDDGSAGKWIRNRLSSLVDSLPVEEFVGQLVSALVEELTGSSEEEEMSSEEQPSGEEAAS